MPFPVAAAIAGGVALAGQGAQMAATGVKNKKQFRRTKELMDKQDEMNRSLAMFNQQQNLEMWEKTGPVGQMEQLGKAGLNPGLIYGMGGAGGQTAAGAQAGATSQPHYEMENAGEGLGVMGLQLASQLQLLKAQKENIEADTVLKQTDAQKKAGVDTDEAKTRISNNILDGVIKDYTGKEAKAMYEEVNQPNRDMQARATTDTYSAQQAMGQTINELFIEGKLKEKSIAEIENILVSNAKTRAERAEIEKRIDLLTENIKGAKLNNIILELESRLQTETGIDRNSPGWLKILGRLFISLTNR